MLCFIRKAASLACNSNDSKMLYLKTATRQRGREKCFVRVSYFTTQNTKKIGTRGSGFNNTNYFQCLIGGVLECMLSPVNASVQHGRVSGRSRGGSDKRCWSSGWGTVLIVRESSQHHCSGFLAIAVTQYQPKATQWREGFMLSFGSQQTTEGSQNRNWKQKWQGILLTCLAGFLSQSLGLPA